MIEKLNRDRILNELHKQDYLRKLHQTIKEGLIGTLRQEYFMSKPSVTDYKQHNENVERFVNMPILHAVVDMMTANLIHSTSEKLVHEILNVIDYLNKKEDAEKGERCSACSGKGIRVYPVSGGGQQVWHCDKCNGTGKVEKLEENEIGDCVYVGTCPFQRKKAKPYAMGEEEIVAILKEHIRIDVSISNGLMGFSTPYKNDDGLRAIAHAIVEGMK